MTPRTPDRPGGLEARLTAFAKERLRHRGLYAAPLPLDTWRRMGDEGLLSIGLPGSREGGGWQPLFLAGRVLAREGGNLGFPLSFLVHQMLAGAFLAGRAPRHLRERFLPRITAGDAILCLAVSEPGAGAHPKHLATTAVAEGNTFRLNGEKTFLTNGPVADIFLVLAITRQEGGRKRYTLFLVPADAEGLQKTGPLALDVLRPSPHGGLVLTDCRVPRAHVVGDPDTAYESLVRPFRRLEETVLMGAILGALEHLLGKVAARGCPPDFSGGHQGFTRETATLHSLLAALALTGWEAAGRLPPRLEPAAPAPLLIANRRLAADALKETTALLGASETASDPSVGMLLGDLTALMGIGRKAPEGR